MLEGVESERHNCGIWENCDNNGRCAQETLSETLRNLIKFHFILKKRNGRATQRKEGGEGSSPLLFAAFLPLPLCGDAFLCLLWVARPFALCAHEIKLNSIKFQIAEMNVKFSEVK